MYKTCPAACDVCSSHPAACADVGNATECKIWADRGECYSNPNFMARECSKSCGLCMTVCADHDDSCAAWSKAGECDSNKDFMTMKCPQSCGICASIEAPAKDEL